MAGVGDVAETRGGAIVGDPADHGRLALAERLIELLGRTLWGANGERHRRKLPEGQRGAAAPRPPLPTTMPAWGPPRSLSPEKETRSRPAPTASCTVGS